MSITYDYTSSTRDASETTEASPWARSAVKSAQGESVTHPLDRDERVSLAPLAPEVALAALLATREIREDSEEVEDLRKSQEQAQRGEVHWLEDVESEIDRSASS